MRAEASGRSGLHPQTATKMWITNGNGAGDAGGLCQDRTECRGPAAITGLPHRESASEWGSDGAEERLDKARQNGQRGTHRRACLRDCECRKERKEEEKRPRARLTDLAFKV